MGLDTVELVMEFEEEFNLTISDEEAEKMQTIGDTVEFIVRTLSKRTNFITTRVCPSARLFYEVRSGLWVQYGVPRNEVRPSSRIADLIPSGPGRATWAEFARTHQLPIPPFSFFPGSRFPYRETRIGDLIRQARKSTPKSMLRDDGTVDSKRVWCTVREIVSEQMGVDIREIHRRTHYINDLNC